MQDITASIATLYKQWKGEEAKSIELLPQSGSERRYFRIYGSTESVIGTYGANIQENKTFIYFSKKFKNKELAVPEILAISDDEQFYLQEDFGTVSLLNHLESKGFSDEVYSLFKKSLEALAYLQIKGDEGLNYADYCLTSEEFGKQAIMADLLYFKYLTHTEYKYFMFRDFQSRNIMVTDDSAVHFIDYQGGMKGAPQYDVASMLWQARANLPDEWKNNLLEDYMTSFEKIIGQSIDKNIFRSQYYGYVLIRLLQVLGAYGFRGLFERKAQFLTSIPLALNNLKDFLKNQSLGISVPEFRKVLDMCLGDEVIQQFTPTQATDETPLVVKVCSFSYRKQLPEDNSGNGGGFLFDCRGILNPGRVDSMKTQTGRDKEVKDFLEQQTKMPEFLNSAMDVVDITVEEYIKRGFESLLVGFGCTGGQHRSVYAADEMVRHLKNKFKVKIELKHIVQEEKNWQNPLPQNN